MTYSDLIACYEHKWPSKLPDLEGEGGYFLFQHKVYYWTYFYGEDEPKIEQVFTVEEFLTKHSDSNDRWMLDVLHELRKR